MFWKKKPKVPSPQEHVTQVTNRLLAMSAARKMVETGTEAERVVLAMNMDAEQRVAAHRPLLPFTFSLGPVPEQASENSVTLIAQTHTEPGARFSLTLNFLPSSDAEEVYDKLVAQDARNISEECPPVKLTVTPAAEGSAVPGLRGEIARIFDSFDLGIDLTTRNQATMTGLVLGAFLVRPETSHAYLSPGKGDWHLLRVSEPVDFYLALNFRENRGEFSSKGVLPAERNPGKLLAYALA